MREDALNIFHYGLNSILPKNLFSNIDFSPYKKVHIFGSGKAVIPSAKALEDILGDKIEDGFVVSNYKKDILNKIEVFESSHPLPSKKSIEAANILMRKMQNLKENDFFIYLLSGGTSALIEKPISSITLDEFIKTTDKLLKSGASIDELNSVRKKLSLIKGGGLAKGVKAKGIVFVISDVIGDDLNTIGSAPLYPIFEHKIVGSNKIALENAKIKAESLGYETQILSDQISGYVKDVAKELSNKIMKKDKPICYLFGGETTVKVTGNGKGGRNQELALWFLKEIKDKTNITFLSAGTDGIDGNSTAAGAIIDQTTYTKAKSLKLDIDSYLKNNDSNSFFNLTNDLIITGNTGTNVMDIGVIIIS